MQTNEKPSAATCANGYIYDPTCDECATNGLAATKSCYQRRVHVEDRLKRCQTCEHMKMDSLFIQEDKTMICTLIGAYCRDINNCTDKP